MPEAGHVGPKTFYQRTTPASGYAPGDYWDNGAQVRVWMPTRGWVIVAGVAVETDA